MINNLVSYFKPDGTPTDEGLKFFRRLDARVNDAEAKLAAIAAVAAPTGGATTDAEARTAINAIIAGAS